MKWIDEIQHRLDTVEEKPWEYFEEGLLSYSASQSIYFSKEFILDAPKDIERLIKALNFSIGALRVIYAFPGQGADKAASDALNMIENMGET